MSAHKKEKSSLEPIVQHSKASNALASKPKATPPKLSKEKKENSEGPSPILKAEVEGPGEGPKSETNAKEEETSFFGQRCDSNEEGIRNRAKGAKNSATKRTTSTALSETSTSEPERELNPQKVRLGITLNGMTM